MADYLGGWLDRPLVQFSRSDCRELHRKVSEENGPYIANRIMRHVRAVLGVFPTRAIQDKPCILCKALSLSAHTAGSVIHLVKGKQQKIDPGTGKATRILPSPPPPRNTYTAPDLVEYDEDKIMLGWLSADASRAAYLEQYDDERYFGGMSMLPLEAFRQRVFAGAGKVAA